MSEEWRAVAGFEEFYQVSSLGRFMSTRTGKLMNPIRRGRYLAISFKNGPKSCLRSAHVVVATAFFGQRPSGLETAHLNGNSHDNRISNLAYVTCKQNEAHKKAHGTSRGQLTDYQAEIIRRLVANGVSQTDIANLLMVSDSVISKVIRGRTYLSEGKSPVGAAETPTPTPEA